MGTRNKERRAAKAKRRAKEHRRRFGNDGRSESWGGRPDEALFTPGERVRGLLELAAMAMAHGDDQYLQTAVGVLADASADLVDREAEAALLWCVAQVWDHGWQPAELVRQARRCDVRTGRLMATAVAADHARRDADTLHPRWAAQIGSLDLPTVDHETGWLVGFAGREALDRRTLVTAVIATLGVLHRLSPLPTVIPPPGATNSTAPTEAAAVTDDPVLVRVRALLCQAESTTFEAEAEAFTAKAQELMARHAIDSAMLWAQTERDERPTVIRVPIDDPYADIKSLLMQHVARHSRCQAVYHPTYALSSVIGFASDVTATEMLFTSLLVQSQAALRVEAAKAGPGGRTRSRSYRSSFLLAYTHRIDGRLAEINAAVATAATEPASSLLPVLAARDDAVDDVVAELFGALESNIVRGAFDRAGWASGTMAANLAQLNFGDIDIDNVEDHAATDHVEVDTPRLPLGL